MFSGEQFRIPNKFRFSCIVVIFRKKARNWIACDLFKLIRELGMESNFTLFHCENYLG